MSSHDTSAFGLLCVTFDFLKRDQVIELLREQEELRARGIRRRIGELGLKRGWLSLDQFLLILRAQGKRIMSCRRCKKSYNIRGQVEGPIPCKHCGEALYEPRRKINPRVFDSMEISKPTTLLDAPAPRRPSPDLSEGLRRLLPGYELLEVLGHGGMGVVYKAWDEILRRNVAVKILAPDLARDEEYVQRFIREARMARRLRHPNIVEAYDCGVAGETKFFLMEYVEGEPLDRILRRRAPLPEKEALDLVRQVAEALDYAWGRSIIHRDIKPQNLLVTPDRIVKICDLGLSRVIGSDSTLTLAGQINCSPGYASPEQGRGIRDLGITTDIYSLGVTFFEMLVGEPPFQGEGPGDLILKHSLEPRPDPRKKNPIVSEASASLVRRMMAIRREDRPAPSDVVQATRMMLSGTETLPLSARLPLDA